MNRRSFKRFLGKRLLKITLISAFIFAIGFIIDCGNNGTQNISPYGGYGVACVAGQAGCTSTCLPGQVGCTNGGYAVYEGYIGSLNNHLANQILEELYGVDNWCLGGCYNGSTIEISISGTEANVMIYFGQYLVSGSGTVTPINNNQGSMVQVGIPGGTISVISNNISLTNGNVNNIPSVPIQYNNQQLGTTSLLLQEP